MIAACLAATLSLFGAIQPVAAPLVRDVLRPAALVACSERYAPAPPIAIGAGSHTAVDAVKRAFQPKRLWGVAENVRLVAHTDSATPALAVHYPKGSIAPSSKAPRGGAGFTSRAGLERGVRAACLRYRVLFAPGFDFAKGGKLPGLFGGDGPSGGASADNGFSARLMWRAGGQGELYAYLPDRAERQGQSLGRAGWRFPTGRWVTIEQEIVLNGPNLDDGRARLWIDGTLRLKADNLVFRRSDDVLIEGLMFSTFFGGNDPSWASPKDQMVLFTEFTLQRLDGPLERKPVVSVTQPPALHRPAS